MRPKTIAALFTAATLSSPGLAQAHISLHPNTIPAGSFVTLEVASQKCCKYASGAVRATA